MYRTYELYPFKVEFLFMRNNNYIIVDKATNQAAIVDPAWNLDKIKDEIHKLGVNLTTILLTHSHHDHVNKVDEILKQYSARVYMSAVEAKYYGFECGNLQTVQDGEVIQLGKTHITCLLTPGHTAGGICFLLTDDLISGDTLFIEGCGTCDNSGGSPEQMYKSFQKIRDVIPSHVRVYPGHTYSKDPGVPLDLVMATNIYFQFETEEQFVKFRMRKNQKNLFNFK
ncbi:MBL fold metallo-hydrolase [Bacillus wiedmannii]|uniref:MBL fold metallo-hydrolase n=1 Tax=Bacillus wiedmannii TaxID=1890302 RepID=UPI000BF3AFD2|nr:MBL fold metallo-hydrolase [Bacillus wiedmannii]PEP92266.1 MBL fold metallo-hydrolase [Bacillus wiedmannii]